MDKSDDTKVLSAKPLALLPNGHTLVITETGEVGESVSAAHLREHHPELEGKLPMVRLEEPRQESRRDGSSTSVGYSRALEDNWDRVFGKKAVVGEA